jgi:hypothetical protein
LPGHPKGPTQTVKHTNSLRGFPLLLSQNSRLRKKRQKGHMSTVESFSGSEGVLKAQIEPFPVLVSPPFLRAPPLATKAPRWPTRRPLPLDLWRGEGGGHAFQMRLDEDAVNQKHIRRVAGRYKAFAWLFCSSFLRRLNCVWQFFAGLFLRNRTCIYIKLTVAYIQLLNRNEH